MCYKIGVIRTDYVLEVAFLGLLTALSMVQELISSKEVGITSAKRLHVLILT